MANEFDIFNISVSDLDTGEKNTQSSDLYSPKPDQGQDGTYRALIRFLPNLKNPRKQLKENRKNKNIHHQNHHTIICFFLVLKRVLSHVTAFSRY